MEKAVRVVSVERGYDPRDFTLVAFGGAGGLHACELAEALSIPRVIVPMLPGALSAFGILVSDVVKNYSRTVLWRVQNKLPADRLAQEFATLRIHSEADFHREKWPGRPVHHGSVDVRYQGQGYELSIPFTQNLIVKFHAEYTTAATATATRIAKSNCVTLRLCAMATYEVHPGRIAAQPQRQGRWTAPPPHLLG